MTKRIVKQINEKEFNDLLESYRLLSKNENDTQKCLYMYGQRQFGMKIGLSTIEIDKSDMTMTLICRV